MVYTTPGFRLAFHILAEALEASYRPIMAEREGFEPSIELLALYSLSRGAPSASRPSLLKLLQIPRRYWDISALPGPFRPHHRIDLPA